MLPNTVWSNAVQSIYKQYLTDNTKSTPTYNLNMVSFDHFQSTAMSVKIDTLILLADIALTNNLTVEAEYFLNLIETLSKY